MRPQARLDIMLDDNNLSAHGPRSAIGTYMRRETARAVEQLKESGRRPFAEGSEVLAPSENMAPEFRQCFAEHGLFLP